MEHFKDTFDRQSKVFYFSCLFVGLSPLLYIREQNCDIAIDLGINFLLFIKQIFCLI